MDSTTYCLITCEAKMVDILRDIVACGFGHFSISIEKVRDFRVKVIITAGRSYIYFIPDSQKITDDDSIF